MPSVIEKFKNNFKTIIFISSCVIILGIILCFVPYVGWPVGLPLICLATLVGGGAILARGSEVVLLNNFPLKPNSEPESYIPYASDRIRSTQSNDDQRKLISELQTVLLPENSLRLVIAQLLNDKSEETKFAIVKALHAQMNLLFEHCSQPENAQLAVYIENLSFIAETLKKDNFELVRADLRAWARGVCNSIDELVRSKEYRQAMPDINEANEQTALLNAAAMTNKAMKSLLASDVLGNMGKQIQEFPIAQEESASNPMTNEAKELKISFGP